MWRWLQNARKAGTVWAKLVWVSSLFHVVVLGVMFYAHVGHRASHYDVQVSARARDAHAQVVVLPFMRVAPTPTVVAMAPVKAPVQKKVAPKPKPKPQRKVKPKTQLAQVKPKPKARIESKPKPQPKPKVKKPERILAQNKVPLQQQVETHAEPEKIYVGRDEWDALQVERMIQQEVSRCWQPPKGLAQDLACAIKVQVDWQGAVKAVMVEKGSGVLMYDVNARSAVLAMNMPRCTWGKELVLHFKQ